MEGIKMSEKTLATIDSVLNIPAGVEKIFENQHIHLDAGIKCEGTLIFKNCTIEPASTLNSDSNKNRFVPAVQELTAYLEPIVSAWELSAN